MGACHPTFEALQGSSAAAWLGKKWEASVNLLILMDKNEISALVNPTGALGDQDAVGL